MSSMAEPIVRRSAAARRIDFSPYLVGVGLGVLSWIAFAVAKDPLGVTTAMSRVAAIFIGPEAAAKNAIGCRWPSLGIMASCSWSVPLAAPSSAH
jgi:uncharacterized protein